MKMWIMDNLFDGFNEFIIPVNEGDIYLNKFRDTNIIKDKIDFIEVNLLKNGKNADCYSIWGLTGILMVSEKAKNVIQNIIKNEIEFVKVVNKDINKAFYALQVLNVIDALDYDKTKFALENALVIEYSFLEKKIIEEDIFIIYDDKKPGYIGKPNIFHIFVSDPKSRIKRTQNDDLAEKYIAIY